MRAVPTALPGVCWIELDVFADDRGFFKERFNERKFIELGIEGFPARFVQDNFSVSRPKVLRGMHFQVGEWQQAKLVGVSSGRILDVAVDIRPDSLFYGKHWSMELDHHRLLYIPEGLAHGFCVLGDEPAHVTYKVNRPYHAPSDRGIHCFDPDLAIAWPYRDALLSPKDGVLPRLKDHVPTDR